MALTFALRGNSLDARYTHGLKAVSLYKAAAEADPVLRTDGTAFGGSVIDISTTGQLRAVHYLARNLLTATAGFSVLMRIKPRWTGATPSPVQRHSLLALSSGINGQNWIQFYINSNGTLGVEGVSKTQGQFLGNTSSTAFTAANGTSADLMFTWNGAAGAGNPVKMSVNGAEVYSGAPLGAMNIDPGSLNSVLVGLTSSSLYSNFEIEELLIFDDVQAHTYTARTAYWTADAFEGFSSSGAGAANIRSGTTEVINGVTVTGSMIAAVAATTKIGVPADAGTTGTYEGNDRNDAILAGELMVGVTKLNRNAPVTGTYAGDDRNDIVAESKVELGHVYLNRNTSKTGTSVGAAHNDLITASQLASGVTKLNRNVSVAGTNKGEGFNGPLAAGNLKLGYTVPILGVNVVGTRVEPGESIVKVGNTYGDPAAPRTGTLQTVTNVIQELTLKGGGATGAAVNQNDVTITRGDALTFQLKAMSGDVEHNLTGATFETRLAGPDGEVVIPESAHAADPDQTTNPGRFTITITAAQSGALKLGEGQPILTKITQVGSLIHFHGRNILQVLSNKIS